MTLEQMLKWKRGSFEEYEKLIKSQDKLNKRLRKINEDLCWEEDALEILNKYDSVDYPRWQYHNDNMEKLMKKKKDILEQINTNNHRLINEFY